MNLPMPNADEIAQFKKIYRLEQGADLTDEEALRKLIGLLHLLPVLATPEELEKMGGPTFVFRK